MEAHQLLPAEGDRLAKSPPGRRPINCVEASMSTRLPRYVPLNGAPRQEVVLLIVARANLGGTARADQTHRASCWGRAAGEISRTAVMTVPLPLGCLAGPGASGPSPNCTTQGLRPLPRGCLLRCSPESSTRCRGRRLLTAHLQCPHDKPTSPPWSRISASPIPETSLAWRTVRYTNQAGRRYFQGDPRSFQP